MAIAHMPMPQVQARADRNLGGSIQIDIHVPGSIRATIALTEAEAIKLANTLREALEGPTLREPVGKNVLILQTVV